MRKLWGMSNSAFALNVAVNGVLLFLIACVWGASAGIPKEVLGIAGAAGLYAWAFTAAKLWNRYAAVPQ